MYEWLWHRLPGPTAAKLIQCALLFFAVVFVLFTWVFPLVEQHLPFTQVTVSSGVTNPAPSGGGISGERMSA